MENTMSETSIDKEASNCNKQEDCNKQFSGLITNVKYDEDNKTTFTDTNKTINVTICNKTKLAEAKDQHINAMLKCTKADARRSRLISEIQKIKVTGKKDEKTLKEIEALTNQLIEARAECANNKTSKILAKNYLDEVKAEFKELEAKKKKEEMQKKEAEKLKILEEQRKLEEQKELEKQTKNNFSKYDVDYKQINSDGNPLATISNTEALFNHLDIAVKHNDMLHNIEIYNPESVLDVEETDDTINELKDCCIRYGLSKQCILDYISIISKKNRYNPIADWIKSKPWDGTSRLADFLNTVTTTDEELKDLLITKWLLAAVASIFIKELGKDETFWCKSMLVFQGKQSLSKTKWFKALVPKSMKKYIRDGLTLDTSNKDDIMCVLGVWFAELGELDATFKTQALRLKAFVTKEKDSYRPPYGKSVVDYPRRTLLFGSVNPQEFLKDDTGNTRYWCIPVTKLNANHNIDMQQLYAEIYQVCFLNGEKWYLTEEEEERLEISNRQFEIVLTLQEKLLERFDLGATRKSYYTPSKVLEILGYDKPTKAEVKDMGSILTRFFEKTRRNYGYLYVMPEPKTQNYGY
jgi:putative DNA primase/helicase